MNDSVGALLDKLVRDGVVPNPDKAYTRLRLDYPTWLILEDMDDGELLAVLSRASGVPVLEEPLTSGLLDLYSARRYGPAYLKSQRWAPLIDGRVAVADPLGSLPDKGSADGIGLCIAPAQEIDAALGAAFPATKGETRGARRLGQLLLDAGLISEKTLAWALDEQQHRGGQLGEILLAHGAVDASAMTEVLSRKLGYPVLQAGETPEPLLPSHKAREWRAVAISTDSRQVTGGRAQNSLSMSAEDTAYARGWYGERRTPVTLALSDPSPEVIQAAEAQLERHVHPVLTDEETLNRLLAEAYAEEDLEEVTTSLLKRKPHFSAYRNRPSLSQLTLTLVFAALLAIGFAVDVLLPIVAMVTVATVFYISFMVFRFYTAWIGWRGESTVRPSMEDLENLEERELPIYTVLLPAYGEKPSTLRELFRSLSKLDYPRHRLDGLLLVEADDHQTQEAIEAIGKPGWMRVIDVPPEVSHTSPESWYFGEEAEGEVGRPGWLKTLFIPPGEPRTKPKAMIYGLLYARGDLLTVYDAEDQPDPYQIKKAVWAYEHLNDDSVACLQAKLNYYNPRQNLLTRWFTLEYSAWFDMFLPGLHEAGAPIPLGGTSNHFRTDVLKEALSWDPYNVTEDADLGLRFARMGKRTMTLESTTYEEANSKLKNWLRQRSRWIKGYMQTFLVHTRHPLTLYREIGLKNCFTFLATVGGLIFTVLASPIFWAILLLWILAQPNWVPQLFPGPVYYMALISLFIGNFFFIFLGVVGAAGRGLDDLTPHALLAPAYWMLMSVAGYMALLELIVKPYYWQKTEHGLHLEEDAGSALSLVGAGSTLENRGD